MRCFVKINLKNLYFNLDKLSKKVEINKIMAVIKSNAYGHGIIEIFEQMYAFGIRNFAVATIEEAVELNKLKDDISILILGLVEKQNYKELENTNILTTVSSFEDLEYMKDNNLKNRIHIAFDSGMTRIGFHKDNIQKLEEYVKLLNIEGIFTHLSSVDFDENYTLSQIDKFNKATDNLGIKKHILNSAGIEKYYTNENYVKDYVRPGISLYGGYKEYRYVMSLYAKVVNIMKVKPNTYVGYDKTYMTKKETYIATLSIGYADGLKRNLSNKMRVFCNGNYYNQVGNICMDFCMIEVDENVNIGDYVEIFGDNISIDEVAKNSGTINYEIMTSISNRIKRIYE